MCGDCILKFANQQLCKEITIRRLLFKLTRCNWNNVQSPLLENQTPETDFILITFHGNVMCLHTVLFESIELFVRGKTSSLPSCSAANSPWWDEFLNLVSHEHDETMRKRGIDLRIGRENTAKPRQMG